jgi:RNA polymerase sigma-70 factor (ECF subfamily)
MADIATHETGATALVDRAASGDEAAFARLVAEHHASMMRVAFVITGDGEASRDAVQSAWSIAWRRLGGLRDRSQVNAWLVAVAANEARQTRRREHRASVVDISDVLEQRGGDDPADVISVVDLRRAMTRLKPDDRALLALRFVGRLDSTQIATQLGLTASGVRSRLARLLERLRAELETGEGTRR